nr:uncharacterized protein LOC113805862 [Penaeus vannamei]
MKYDYVILMSLTLLWFPAPVTLLEVSRKLPLEEESAFLKGGAEFGNRQDIWSSLHTFCDLHCGKNDEMLTEDYQSANMSAANMQIGRRLFQKLYPRASSKRPVGIFYQGSSAPFKLFLYGQLHNNMILRVLKD